MIFNPKEVIQLLKKSGFDWVALVQTNNPKYVDPEEILFLATGFKFSLLLNNPLVSNFISPIKENPKFTWKSSYRIKVIFCEEGSWGSHTLFLRGPQFFVDTMVTKANSLGLILTEEGLFRGKDQLAGSTEEGIFRELGFNYISPKNRWGKVALSPLVQPDDSLAATGTEVGLGF